jgi:hypothetical protein
MLEGAPCEEPFPALYTPAYMPNHSMIECLRDGKMIALNRKYVEEIVELLEAAEQLTTSLNSLSRWAATCETRNPESWLVDLFSRVEDAQILTGLMNESERVYPRTTT